MNTDPIIKALESMPDSEINKKKIRLLRQMRGRDLGTWLILLPLLPFIAFVIFLGIQERTEISFLIIAYIMWNGWLLNRIERRIDAVVEWITSIDRSDDGS